MTGSTPRAEGVVLPVWCGRCPTNGYHRPENCPEGATVSIPTYTVVIKETDAGWFWRVAIDVPNGRGWHGIAESYAKAAEEATTRLRSIEP